jgi:hypothetical protein
MTLPAYLTSGASDELEQVCGHLIEAYGIMENYTKQATPDQEAAIANRLSKINGFFQQVLETPPSAFNGRRTSWGDIEEQIEGIVREEGWLKLAQRMHVEDVAASVAHTAHHRQRRNTVTFKGAEEDRSDSSPSNPPFARDLFSPSPSQAAKSPKPPSLPAPAETEVYLRSVHKSHPSDSHMGLSKVCLQDGVMVRLWLDPRSARNFVHLWSRVWQTLFEHRIVGIYCPFTAMFCIQGEYITVTALPPVRMEGRGPHDYRTWLPKLDGIALYMATRLNVALCAPSQDEIALSLLPGADGRLYVASIEPLLVGSCHISGFDGLIARTEMVIQAAFAEVAPTIQPPSKQVKTHAGTPVHSVPHGSQATLLSTHSSDPFPSSPLISCESSRGGFQTVVAQVSPTVFLKDHAIPALIRELMSDFATRSSEERKNMCKHVSGHVLRDMFHRHGVNMSLLYYVFRQIGTLSSGHDITSNGLDDVMRLLRTEMVGRLLKRLVRQDFALRVKLKSDRLETLRILKQLLETQNAVFWANVNEGLREKFSAPRDFHIALTTVSLSAALTMVVEKVGCVMETKNSTVASVAVLASAFAKIAPVGGEISPPPLPNLSCSPQPAMRGMQSGEFTGFLPVVSTVYAFVKLIREQPADDASLAASLTRTKCRYLPVQVGHPTADPDAAAKHAMKIAQWCHRTSMQRHTFLLRAFFLATLCGSPMLQYNASEVIRDALVELQEVEQTKAHGGSGSPGNSSLGGSDDSKGGRKGPFSDKGSSPDSPRRNGSFESNGGSSDGAQKKAIKTTDVNKKKKKKMHRAASKFEAPLALAVACDDFEPALELLKQPMGSFKGNGSCGASLLLLVSHCAVALRRLHDSTAALGTALQLLSSAPSPWIDYLFARQYESQVFRLVASASSMEHSEIRSLLQSAVGLYVMHEKSCSSRCAAAGGLLVAGRIMSALTVLPHACSEPETARHALWHAKECLRAKDDQRNDKHFLGWLMLQACFCLAITTCRRVVCFRSDRVHSDDAAADVSLRLLECFDLLRTETARRNVPSRVELAALRDTADLLDVERSTQQRASYDAEDEYFLLEVAQTLRRYVQQHILRPEELAQLNLEEEAAQADLRVCSELPPLLVLNGVDGCGAHRMCVPLGSEGVFALLPREQSVAVEADIQTYPQRPPRNDWATLKLTPHSIRVTASMSYLPQGCALAFADPQLRADSGRLLMANSIEGTTSSEDSCHLSIVWTRCSSVQDTIRLLRAICLDCSRCEEVPPGSFSVSATFQVEVNFCNPLDIERGCVLARAEALRPVELLPPYFTVKSLAPVLLFTAGGLPMPILESPDVLLPHLAGAVLTVEIEGLEDDEDDCEELLLSEADSTVVVAVDSSTARRQVVVRGFNASELVLGELFGAQSRRKLCMVLGAEVTPSSLSAVLRAVCYTSSQIQGSPRSIATTLAPINKLPMRRVVSVVTVTPECSTMFTLMSNVSSSSSHRVFRAAPTLAPQLQHFYLLQPRCYLASHAVLRDADHAFLTEGYLEVRIADGSQLDRLDCILRGSCRLEFSTDRTEVLSQGKKVAAITSSAPHMWRFEFIGVRVGDVQTLARSMTFASSRLPAAGDMLQVRWRVQLGDSPPEAASCSVLIGAPLASLPPAASVVVLSSGARRAQPLPDIAVSSEDGVKWAGGWLRVEFDDAEGIDDLDELMLLPSPLVEVVDRAASVGAAHCSSETSSQQDEAPWSLRSNISNGSVGSSERGGEAFAASEAKEKRSAAFLSSVESGGSESLAAKKGSNHAREQHGPAVSDVFVDHCRVGTMYGSRRSLFFEFTKRRPGQSWLLLDGDVEVTRRHISVILAQVRYHCSWTSTSRRRFITVTLADSLHHATLVPFSVSMSQHAPLAHVQCPADLVVNDTQEILASKGIRPFANAVVLPTQYHSLNGCALRIEVLPGRCDADLAEIDHVTISSDDHVTVLASERMLEVDGRSVATFRGGGSQPLSIHFKTVFSSRQALSAAEALADKELYVLLGDVATVLRAVRLTSPAEKRDTRECIVQATMALPDAAPVSVRVALTLVPSPLTNSVAGPQVRFRGAPVNVFPHMEVRALATRQGAAIVSFERFDAGDALALPVAPPSRFTLRGSQVFLDDKVLLGDLGSDDPHRVVLRFGVSAKLTGPLLQEFLRGVQFSTTSTSSVERVILATLSAHDGTYEVRSSLQVILGDEPTEISLPHARAVSSAVRGGPPVFVTPDAVLRDPDTFQFGGSDAIDVEVLKPIAGFDILTFPELGLGAGATTSVEFASVRVAQVRRKSVTALTICPDGCSIDDLQGIVRQVGYQASSHEGGSKQRVVEFFTHTGRSFSRVNAQVRVVEPLLHYIGPRTVLAAAGKPVCPLAELAVARDAFTKGGTIAVRLEGEKWSLVLQPLPAPYELDGPADDCNPQRRNISTDRCVIGSITLKSASEMELAVSSDIQQSAVCVSQLLLAVGVITEAPHTLMVGPGEPLRGSLHVCAAEQNTERAPAVIDILLLAEFSALPTEPHSRHLLQILEQKAFLVIISEATAVNIQAEEHTARQSLSAKVEADRKAKEEADRKAKEEADRKAKEEADRKAKEEADRKAMEEADRKAKEEADRKAKEEADRKRRKVNERKKKDVADTKAKNEGGPHAKEWEPREARGKSGADAGRVRILEDVCDEGETLSLKLGSSKRTQPIDLGSSEAVGGQSLVLQRSESFSGPEEQDVARAVLRPPTSDRTVQSPFSRQQHSGATSGVAVATVSSDLGPVRRVASKSRSRPDEPTGPLAVDSNIGAKGGSASLSEIPPAPPQRCELSNSEALHRRAGPSAPLQTHSDVSTTGVSAQASRNQSSACLTSTSSFLPPVDQKAAAVASYGSGLFGPGTVSNDWTDSPHAKPPTSLTIRDSPSGADIATPNLRTMCEKTPAPRKPSFSWCASARPPARSEPLPEPLTVFPPLEKSVRQTTSVPLSDDKQLSGSGKMDASSLKRKPEANAEAIIGVDPAQSLTRLALSQRFFVMGPSRRTS